MTQQHEKISDNKTDVSAAYQGGGNNAVQLKNNRKYSVVQLKLAERTITAQPASFTPIQRKANNTGLPQNLKSGIENLSGHSMYDVKVHYNSDKPAQLNAHAYAQGTDIHIASGQEKHLPHEAWHVVQQKQGRVKPTVQMKGKVNVNDDKGLEKEADVMGAKAIGTNNSRITQMKAAKENVFNLPVIQLGKRERKAKQKEEKKELHGRKQRFIKAFNTAEKPFVLKRQLQQQYLGNELAQANIKNAWEESKAFLFDAKLNKASFIYDINDLSPKSTIIMRSINTGDMYHIRASMVIHPTYKLLIWFVNDQTKPQAQMIADLINDPSRVYYNPGNPPSGFSNSETWATKDIETFIGSRILNDDRIQQLKAAPTNPLAVEIEALLDCDLEADTVPDIKILIGRLQKSDAEKYIKVESILRQVKINELANKFAPYSEDEGLKFQEDLQNSGKFPAGGGKYIIVNYRGTGHSGRLGANAPALDTGVKGVQQIMAKIHEIYGSSVHIVPMGEEPSSMNNIPNLLNYWMWPSAKGSRLRQSSLLKYLNEHYNILGAIGMRSGVIDQLAFAGIKVISIDIGPHKGIVDNQLPDLSTSKGWDRGLKLENAYREKYGHVFIEHNRKGEQKKDGQNWAGKFHKDDVETIGDAVKFYFNDKATPDKAKHKSHPLTPNATKKAFADLEKLSKSKTINSFELIRNITPYVRHIQMHFDATGIDKLIIQKINEKVEAKIAEVDAGQKKDIKWMAQNIRRAIINNDKSNLEVYNQQKAYLATELGIQDEDEAVEAYKEMNKHYNEKFIFKIEIEKIFDALHVKNNQAVFENRISKSLSKEESLKKEIQRLQQMKSLTKKQSARLLLRIKQYDKSQLESKKDIERLENSKNVFKK